MNQQTNHSTQSWPDRPAIFPDLMTEAEAIAFLRIPEISKAGNYRNVIENLKRMHHLPCIHICRQPLYPLAAVKKWVEDKTS